jgi:cyclic beta-1,2-glucan synthetase
MGEPYVLCGDVYSAPPHVGRAGWSWYTGSAGWLFQAGLEYILGLKVRGDHFVVDPCIPASWDRFELRYRRGRGYHIRVENPQRVERGVVSVKLDGKDVPDHRIPIETEGGIGEVWVLMGRVN